MRTGFPEKYLKDAKMMEEVLAGSLQDRTQQVAHMSPPLTFQDDILCSGYLEKACPLDNMVSSIAAAAGKGLRTTTRYFVLRASSTCLEYFTAEGQRGQKKGAIDLTKCNRITPDAQIPGKFTKPNTFALEVEDRIVYLNTNTREMMGHWVTSITSHLSNLERANNQGMMING